MRKLMIDQKFSRKPLIFSILLNIILVFVALSSWVYFALMGCAETADGAMGVLKRDIEVVRFGEDQQVFRLPKGLVVQDAHATGAGYFEPYRFRIVVTSDDEGLVDYSSPEAASAANLHGNYYSAKK